MKKILLILFISSSAWGAGPKYAFSDPRLNDELTNIYKDIASLLKGSVRISSVTISSSIVSGNLKVPNGVTSNDAAAFGQIKVIQCQFSSNASAFSTTSNAFQSTNSNINITLTSVSNNVAIFAVGVLFDGSPTASTAVASIFRGTTNLGGGTDSSIGSISAAAGITGNTQVPAMLFAVDSPASASLQNYIVKINSSDNSHTVSWGQGSKTYIMACEIAP